MLKQHLVQVGSVKFIEIDGAKVVKIQICVI